MIKQGLEHRLRRPAAAPRDRELRRRPALRGTAQGRVPGQGHDHRRRQGSRRQEAADLQRHRRRGRRTPASAPPAGERAAGRGPPKPVVDGTSPPAAAVQAVTCRARGIATREPFRRYSCARLTAPECRSGRLHRAPASARIAAQVAQLASYAADLAAQPANFPQAASRDSRMNSRRAHGALRAGCASIIRDFEHRSCRPPPIQPLPPHRVAAASLQAHASIGSPTWATWS